MIFNRGDFIMCAKSIKPALVINRYEDNSLISIFEYKGDYIFMNNDEAEIILLQPEEELSLIAEYGSWFYEQHTIMYQEIILKNLVLYFVKTMG